MKQSMFVNVMIFVVAL